MATIKVLDAEYNWMMNNIEALESALEAQLRSNSLLEGFFGNTYIYLTDGGGVDGWLVDEERNRIPDRNYVKELSQKED
jgi:hypothetical protein